jgi:hypothetical protein
MEPDSDGTLCYNSALDPNDDALRACTAVYDVITFTDVSKRFVYYIFACSLLHTFLLIAFPKVDVNFLT